MALDHFVDSGPGVRFSVHAFINGSLDDATEFDFERLADACDYARELASSYHGEAVEPGKGADTLATPDIIVLSPHGAELVTRWIVQSVYDGVVSPFQRLITVEEYREDSELCSDCGDPLPDGRVEGGAFEGRCGPCALEHELEREKEDDVEDDDPQCVCGVFRSEHAMMGCPEGFQSPKAWEREKAFIGSLSEDDYERIYGDR